MIKRKNFFVVLFLFLFAFAIRATTVDKMGRTWDEDEYVEVGYHYLELAKGKNFSDPFWYKSDHPPLARYIYGIAEQAHVLGHTEKGEPIFAYDFTVPRLVSAFIASLAVVIVVVFCLVYMTTFVAITAGIIFAMLPFFVGLSQLATLESFMTFTFTAAVASFIVFLDKGRAKWALLTGIFSGLALLTKQSNILLFPLFFGIYGLWYAFVGRKENIAFFNKRSLAFCTIGCATLATFFILWPWPFFHIQEVLDLNHKMWLANVNLPPPEVFFGKLVLVPKFYYVVMFLITTPLLLLGCFSAGLLSLDKKKDWILYSTVLWFFFPFLQSFYNFKQHGIRYIIEIYAPFSVIAAIGFAAIVSIRLKKEQQRYIALLLLVIYQSFILYKASPYYLDYFNEVVGGVRTIYQKQLFQIGWWGQGTKEAMEYIATIAEPGSKVGFTFSKPAIVPRPKGLIVMQYDDVTQFDYVIVNTFSVVRERFDDSTIKARYKRVQAVTVDGAVLVDIYKKR